MLLSKHCIPRLFLPFFTARKTENDEDLRRKHYRMKGSVL
jgi:hypothetical protein